MSSSLLPALAIALGIALPAAARPSPPQGEPAPAAPAAAPAYTNTELLDAWSGLAPETRRDVVEHFQQQLSWSESVQLELMRFVLESSEVDAGMWDRVPPTPYFDPAEHAPAQAIPRKPVPPESESAHLMRARLLANVPERSLETAWIYDYAAREIRLARDDRDPDLIFRNALKGFPPQLDYAEALVEQMLDDGSQQAALAAFAHSYTDRDGNVFPGVTLYDAWASGAELEMPDVDTLGVIHAVLDDWRTWTAPVSGSSQGALYRKIGELFGAAHKHRGLRKALARTYLVGTPVLRDGYQESLTQLHAMWEAASSTPATLRASLPDPAGWEKYLEMWSKKSERKVVRDGASNRRNTLDAGAVMVRGLMIRAMEALGALRAPELAAATVSAPEPGSTAEPGPVEATWTRLDPAAEAALVASFRELRKRPREELLQRCVDAARASGALQVELIDAWLADAPARLEPATEVDAHDAKEFKGGPKRKRVRDNSSKWKSLAGQLPLVAPTWTRGADYEFGTGKVVALEVDDEDPTWVLGNLLDGVLPGQDVAEARVMQALDAGGPLRVEAEFFSHLYSDRDGNAYEGITLYDVWSNGLSLEVPDVDARAYAIKVWKDNSVPVPLAKEDQKLWYPRMGESLMKLRRHLIATRSLAAVWFQGRPVLAVGYRSSVDTLHALIALANSDPAALRTRLERDGMDFLGRALPDIQAGGPTAWPAGNARRDELLLGRQRIRQAALDVLREEGLL